jgi:hypothetical protein
MERTLDIFIDELVTNEEFRDSFLRSPVRTLKSANEWGLPFCDSEIRRLLAAKTSVWDHIAEELDERLRVAA